MQLLKLRVAVLLPPPIVTFKTKCFSSSSSLQYSAWSGLETWRESPINEDRRWGQNGPEPQPSIRDGNDPPLTVSSTSSLAELGALVLKTSDPLAKSRLSHVVYSTWRLHNLPIGAAQPPSRPSRPPKPHLVCAFFEFDFFLTILSPKWRFWA